MKFRFNKESIFILAVVVFAFLLRVYGIDKDLLYHRDQGLVAMDIYKIWHDKKISLIGAPTDVDGLYHSPVYYWILTPLYWLGRGDVVYPAIFQILLEMLSLPLLYFGVKKLFDKKTAIFTLILYSVSYGLISYSRWFITVPFILPLANILIYFLSKGKNIFRESLLVGMISQTNAAAGVFYIPFILFRYRKEINLVNLIKSATAFIIPAIPLVVFQFRHDFVIFKTVAAYSSGSAGLGFSLSVYAKNLVIFLQEINHIIYYPFAALTTFLFIYGLSKIKQHKELIFSYIFIPFVFLGLYQRGAISFFFMAALPMLLSVVVFGITKFPLLLRNLFLITVIVSNLLLLKNVYEPNNALIPIGDRNVITISDRKKIIDWMYKKAEGKDFSLWIYTIPYFQDYPWDYLFTTYALPKYGYLPEKTGSFSKNDLNKSVYFFNVYEVDHDNSSRQDSWFFDIQNNFGKTKEYVGYHDVHIELRSWSATVDSSKKKTF